MSDIHYIPDNMDQTIENMNQIPTNSTANNSKNKIRFTKVLPKFRLRKEKDSRPTKTLDQLMRRYQEHVDANALIVFPIAFLLFNIGYWVHYLIFRTQT